MIYYLRIHIPALHSKINMADIYRKVPVSVSSLRSTIETDWNDFVSGSDRGYAPIIDMTMALFERVNDLESAFSKLLADHNQRGERMDSLFHEIDFLRYENGILSLKLATVEDTTKLMNLRIEGIGEAQNENLKQTVADCLSKSGVTCNIVDIDYAKRLGKFKQGQSRPILVRLQRLGLRNAIYFNKAKINSNSPTQIWVNDDVSETTQIQRKKVRDVVYLAKQKGVTDIKIHTDGVIINDTKYQHADLDLLPPEISVEKAKSREEEDDIFFQGESSPFSNFYPCTIMDENGRVFYNLEQAFQYKKAKMHGNILLSNKIARTRNPVSVKKLAKKIQISKEWRAAEENYMAELLMAKFTQNASLAQILLDTGERQIHEATGDRKWGIGCGLSSKALSTEEWRGKDLLGQLLENTREALKGSRGIGTMESREEDYEGNGSLPSSDDDAEDDYEECVNEPDTDLKSLVTSSSPPPSGREQLSLSSISTSSRPAAPATPSPTTPSPSLTEAPTDQTHRSDQSTDHTFTDPASTHSTSQGRQKQRNPFRASHSASDETP